MNVLIIASKSDSKVYRQIIQKAPDIKVLGALHKVDKHTYKAVAERYLPHILLIDDSSIKQKTDLFEILTKLRRTVPTLKIVIVSENQLYRKLNAFAIVDGLLPDTVLLDMLKTAAEQYGNPEYTYNYQAENTVEQRIKENRAVPKFYKIAVFSSACILAIVLAAVILFNPETDSGSELPTQKVLRSTISSSKLSKKSSSVSSTVSPRSSSPTDETIRVIQLTRESIEETSNYAEKPSVTSKSKVLPSSVYKPTEPKTFIKSPESSVFSKRQPTSKPITATKPVKQTTLRTPSATKTQKIKPTTKKPKKKSKTRRTTKPKTTSPATTFTEPVITSTTKEFKNTGQKDVIIKLSYSSKTLYEAESFTLNAKVENSSDTVVWTSSDNKVAAVSSTGYVKAYSVGTATITAQIGSSKAECEVTVIPR